MKLALVSDIHANLDALQAALAGIAEQRVDRIVCLGDIVGSGGHPAECVRLIRDNKAICVTGNHDLGAMQYGIAADDLAFLRSLPLKTVIADQVVAVHGALHPQTGCTSERLDTQAQRSKSFAALMAHPSGARLCAFGHTHRAGIYEFHNGRAVERTGPVVELRRDTYYLINPGTIGEPRGRNRRRTYMVLDLARRIVTLHRIAHSTVGHKARLVSEAGAAMLGRLRAIARSDPDWRSSAL